MNKCPDCNRNIRQYQATHIGDTVKRYYVCLECEMVFVEVLDSPLGYNGTLIDTYSYPLKREEEKKKTFQSKLI